MSKVEALEKLVIIYVEKDIKLQKTITKHLQTIFDDIYTFSNTLEAVKQAKKTKPDIVVTNIDHSRLNGLDLIKAIKVLNPNSESIITSATNDKKLLLEALRLDVVDFIDKPFELNVLTAALIKANNKIGQKKEFIELKRKSIEEEISNEDETDIHKIFQMLKRDDIPVDIINFYKGVPIINTGFIKDIKEDSIYIQTQSLQKLVMSLESFINIESSVLPKPIKLDVSDMKSYTEPVKLVNPKIKDFSLRRRKDIRLMPCDSFNLYLVIDDHKIKVSVDDVSTQLITYKVANIEDQDLLDEGIQADAFLSFNLDKGDQVEMNFKCEITQLKRDPKNIIYAIKPIFEKEQQEDLVQYLLQREFQIISELKNLRLINGI